MTHSSRRKFIGTVAALAGATMLPLTLSATPDVDSKWDMKWLDKLTGKHKQVFDLEHPDSLGVVRNWLNAYEEVYGLKYPDINAVIGAPFSINAGHELYKNFPVGEKLKITDPETQKPATRNIYLEGGKTPREQSKTVLALQARGVIFWQCNNELKRTATELAEAVKRPEADVYTELKAGLNPGVILVPAHTMLIGLAQEHGCTYEML